MSAPRLNRPLELQAAQRISDGAGGYIEQWQTLGTLWAELRAGTGRRAGAQALTVSRVPLRVIVRAAPVLAPSRPQPDQRFRDGARIYRIQAVADYDAEGRFLLCSCLEEEV